ncbi:PhnA domain-containing protein [Zhouia spongiae]|uniref:PhnA domain-containing protein n=1 Tax=Zhouia spongiae TaxID=2202721 RepID=A0ABY3YNL4_9FLAO|nr:alkylphosphonate utilization protein [Zhouia spongiae]UNY99417.1 PhnA domain-containing protein [Zhouia spongiae]
MSVLKSLQDRSRSSCELCGAKEKLSIYTVPPAVSEGVDNSLLACAVCIEQMEDADKIEPNHWRCLNDSMWSEHQAVKVMAWRMLSRLRGEGWPQDLLDMMYLEEEELKIAKAMGDGEDPDKPKHLDSNGAELQNGDNVVLIKDLDVKGAGFTAKRGTAVRRISLVHDNPEQIEGKVDGQHIVILTKYVKKS